MLLKADLHIHSTHSDGKSSPREIILTAMYKNLDVISITDHNTFSGAVEAAKITRSIPEAPLIIIGNEVRTDEGDILVYCTEPFDAPKNIGLLIDKAHENNCLVVPAHPFDILRLGIGDVLFEYKGWDAIEVWNASANLRANKEAIKAAKLLNLPSLASSDAHIPDYIGVAYTIIDVDNPTVEDVLESIRKGKTKPHPGYPPFKSLIKRFSWSIERRIRKTINKN